MCNSRYKGYPVSIDSILTEEYDVDDMELTLEDYHTSLTNLRKLSSNDPPNDQGTGTTGNEVRVHPTEAHEPVLQGPEEEQN
jgi:hypothetical protein